MAVRLEAGEHTVQLSYSTPYLKEGCVLSVAALAGAIALAAVWSALYFRRAGSPATGDEPDENKKEEPDEK